MWKSPHLPKVMRISLSLSSKLREPVEKLIFWLCSNVIFLWNSEYADSDLCFFCLFFAWDGSTVTEKELLSNFLPLHQLRLNFFAMIWLTHIFQTGDVFLERALVLVCNIYRLLVLFNPACFSDVTINYFSQLFRWLYDKNASSIIRCARLKSGLVFLHTYDTFIAEDLTIDGFHTKSISEQQS